MACFPDLLHAAGKIPLINKHYHGMKILTKIIAKQVLTLVKLHYIFVLILFPSLYFEELMCLVKE